MNINEFTATFRGGARATLFRVEVPNPANGAADNILPFMAKASHHPAWTLNELEAPYMGRKVYFSGHRTYDPWATTIQEDEPYKVRNALENWSNFINRVQDNTRGFANGEDASYKSVAKVYQLGKTGETLRVYSLFGIWPQSIGQIDLAWDNDAIQQYEVSWRFDYLEVTDGTTGNAGGN